MANDRFGPKAAEMHIAIKQTFDKLGKISRTAAFGEILKSPLPANCGHWLFALKAVIGGCQIRYAT
jgi:hypothetical protein